MKTLILTLLLTLTSTITYSAEVSDTLQIYPKKYELIADTTISSKGNPVVHYYILIEGNLYLTDKSSYTKIKLCQKYNANINFYAIVVTKPKTVKKIICL